MATHTSIPIDAPIEIIDVQSINPLISKCQIKAFYVSDEPNRNGTVIDKETAKKIAESIPGSPVVGYYDEKKEDFDGHNRIFEFKDGKLKITPTTKPYGFVDTSAKVWFQKFLDDDEVEREYVMTEAYLWTGQFKEAQRIIDEGNNHSMELDEETVEGFWTNSDNNSPQFFIINEAIISKFCILGEDVEPCFEGSTITKVQYSFDDSFKEQLYSMMDEIKKYEGGAHQMFTQYAAEIGDALWSNIWRHVSRAYPDPRDHYCSAYNIEGIYEEGESKFVILQCKETNAYFKLNFTLSDNNVVEFSNELEDVSKTFVPAATPQFALEDVEKFAAEYKKQEEEKKKEEEKDPEEEETEGEDPEKKKKGKKEQYNLDEIEEYVELRSKYETLETENAALNSTIEELTAANEELTNFKLSIERKDKEQMINETFFMLSEEDKKNVIENIDTYSLDEIEKELSVICVRNKVNFNLEEETTETAPTNYNLADEGLLQDEAVPAWVSAVLKVQESKK